MEAFHLCLYGSLALGTKISKDQYFQYLDRRVHSSSSLLVQPTYASVAITFSYADAGRIHAYEVTRSWGKSGASRTVERIDVKRDGESLGDFAIEQWQDFIQELIPPGVSNLFFFDGERIQQLADDLTDQAALSSSIKSLLGVHLLDRLHSDLNIYQARLVQNRKGDEPATKLDQLSAQISAASALIAEKKKQCVELENEIAGLQAKGAQTEQALTAAGGGYAKRREQLIRRREEAKAATASLEAGIRQLCTTLFPFAVIPNLLRDLKKQLELEHACQANAAGQAMVKVTREAFVELVQKADFGDSNKNKQRHRQLVSLFDRAAETAEARGAPKTRIVHHLSPVTSQQLLSWIDQSITVMPETAFGMSTELEVRYRELQKATDELKRVPPDDLLAPLVAELNANSQAIGDRQRQLLGISDELRSAEIHYRELQVSLNHENERLQKAAGIDSRLRLIPRVQTALDLFSEKLVNDRVKRLEQELTQCFNALSRKSDPVRRVGISRENFAVVLYDAADSALPKQSLSAGEKQIYAIALLWALAKVSERPLPLIIDTPLGRLDSDHRRLLVERYFPHASHQVILLSTDTEIDRVYFQELRPRMSHCYRLEFDMTEKCSSVNRGYFGDLYETHQNQTDERRIQPA
jgi:DNA sulfur modification protein DndD